MMDTPQGPDRSGDDLDIWGDGRPTNSTPIPEEWERGSATEDTESTEREQ